MAKSFIQQKFTSDCAVACLAMFLDVAYEDVARHCSGAELVWAGLAPSREAYICGLFDVEVVRRDRTLVDWAGPAILTVPSLNSPKGSTHAVYWDGRRVWDPNHGRPGRKAYTNQAAQEVAITALQRAED
ncbi:MAG TPA: hypothetical protein VKA19_10565 [Alphaproteobacteria bacterium]|nr:hypothetical protein [Alphaproteobacteria bacterium]